MSLVQEDLWSESAVYVVTTNGTLRSNGSLVMGRGAALQATQKYPGIDAALGHTISQVGRKNGAFYQYGYCGFCQYGYHDVYGYYSSIPVAAFQVKFFWGDDASMWLIKFSTDMFGHVAASSPETFSMNFPGIGNGRLGRYRNEILSIPKVLPDNVTVCYN